jgi:hypothetical protein
VIESFEDFTTNAREDKLGPDSCFVSALKFDQAQDKLVGERLGGTIFRKADVDLWIDAKVDCAALAAERG